MMMVFFWKGPSQSTPFPRGFQPFMVRQGEWSGRHHAFRIAGYSLSCSDLLQRSSAVRVPRAGSASTRLITGSQLLCVANALYRFELTPPQLPLSSISQLQVIDHHGRR